MNEAKIRRALEHVEKPRLPRPEFERALLTRLLDDDAVKDSVREGLEPFDDVVPIAELHDELGPARRRGTFLLGALAAVLVVVIGLAVIVAQGGSDVSVTRETPAPTADDACRTFSEATFDGVTGRELIGIQNATVLADPSLAATRVAAFAGAIRQLQSGLRATGVESARLNASFAEILRFVADVEDFIATDQMPRVAERLHESETVVTELERELTSLGVVNCVDWIS